MNPTAYDPALYVKVEGSTVEGVISFYVDDMFIPGNIVSTRDGNKPPVL